MSLLLCQDSQYVRGRSLSIGTDCCPAELRNHEIESARDGQHHFAHAKTENSKLSPRILSKERALTFYQQRV